MLGCHVVGERAVEIVQVVAIDMAAGLSVDNLAKIPLSFPTYTAIVAGAGLSRCPADISGVRR
jgi:pyruvate/2-oxoglutarate dehydrogenase complex dihydrolipoamide dehydrogenase (E3) component